MAHRHTYRVLTRKALICTAPECKHRINPNELHGKDILCPICLKEFRFSAEFLMTTCPDCIGLSPLDKVDLNIVLTHLVELRATLEEIRALLATGHQKLEPPPQLPVKAEPYIQPRQRRPVDVVDEKKARDAAKHLLTYANASTSVVEAEVASGIPETVNADLMFDAMQLFVQEEERKRKQNERNGSAK